MEQQGTVASVETDMGHGRLYTTIVMPRDEAASYGASGSPFSRVDDTGTYNPELFRLSLPQVEGGTKVSLKITWFQPMTFANGLYSVWVPFVFPDFILPLATEPASITSIICKFNTGTSNPVEVGSFNNPMKVWSDAIFPNLIFQEPSPGESDYQGTFCLSISPPDLKSTKVFRRAVVFLLDRSGSMNGEPIEDARQALFFGLDSLQPEASFNIIAFDHELSVFSPHIENVTIDAFGHAHEKATIKCTARVGTDILGSLQQAFRLLESSPEAVPYVLLITDGAVADERSICLFLQSRSSSLGGRAPRISTFGTGGIPFHFKTSNLQHLVWITLNMTGIKCSAESALDSTIHVLCGSVADKIRGRMERMLVAASTPLLTNISLTNLPYRCEVYPFPKPDLFCGNPLAVSGTFYGKFPEFFKVIALLPDQSMWEVEVRSRRTNTVPLNKVCAKQQLDLLTARAWLHGGKGMEEQAVNLSVATGIPCEYTRMIGFETTTDKYVQLLHGRQQGKKKNINKYTVGKAAGVALVEGLVIGFGSIAATAANSAVGDVLGSFGSIVGSFAEAPGACCFCCSCGDELTPASQFCCWGMDIDGCCSSWLNICSGCEDICSSCGDHLGCCV